MDEIEVKQIKCDARVVAMETSQLINESLINIGMSGKPKIMSDAQEIYNWLIQDL